MNDSCHRKKECRSIALILDGQPAVVMVMVMVMVMVKEVGLKVVVYLG